MSGRASWRALRRASSRGGTLLAGAVLGLLCLELAFRVWHVFSPRWTTLDVRRGWRLAANLERTVERRDLGGASYTAVCRTDANGFGAYGDPRSARSKLLVLGDSFTQVGNVSNEDMYFAVLGRSLDLEVFAYGCSGYGTLQELMLLEEFQDRIQPDLVLWQFCSNDLVNNDYELESLSSRNNNGLRRPYLGVGGEPFYALPRHPAWLRNLANQRSDLLYLVLHRLDRLFAARAPDVEAEIQRVGESHDGLRRSARVTAELLQRVRRRSRPARLVAFCVDDWEPAQGVLRRLATEAGMEFVQGIPQAIRAAEQAGVVARISDGAHWNAAGHRICAERLADHLRRARRGSGP